jgi:hypothetical protein
MSRRKPRVIGLSDTDDDAQVLGSPRGGGGSDGGDGQLKTKVSPTSRASSDANDISLERPSSKKTQAKVSRFS